MPAINEIGNKYNHLMVIKESEPKNGRKFWVCKCEICEKEYIYSGSDLRKKSETINCPECEKIGNIYGKLTVVKYSHTTKDRHKYWLCECECGNKEIIKSTDLNTGKRKECLICQKKKRKIQYIDESGKVYGRLKVLELDREKSGKIAYWRCQCECGSLLTISGLKLRSYHTQSCGCLNSKGEFKISQILTKENISFKKEIKFQDCVYQKQLRFDFGVYEKDNLLYLIEFDGEQHFLSRDSGWNNDENLLETQKRDKIKNDYCKTNNIPLIRIPYYHLENLTINDLLLTSNFLIKE